jgi:tetratricopeptide (TPR) repeat protein
MCKNVKVYFVDAKIRICYFVKKIEIKENFAMGAEETLLDAKQEVNVSLEEMLGMESTSEKIGNINGMKAAAEQGDKKAIFFLGLTYEMGESVPKDMSEAMYWYEQSDEAYAKLRMGIYYKLQGNEELEIKAYQKGLEAPQENYPAKIACCGNLLAKCFQDKKGEDLDLELKYLRQGLSYEDMDNWKKTISKIGLAVQVELIKAGRFEESAECLQICQQYDLQLDPQMDLQEQQKKLWCLYEEVLKQADKASPKLLDEALAALSEQAEKGNETYTLDICLYYMQHPDENREQYLYWARKAADCGMWVGIAAQYPEKHLTGREASALLKEMKNSGSRVLKIPDGYTHIDEFAFHCNATGKYVKEIEEVFFPDSVLYIANHAFFGAQNLTRIHLPKCLYLVGCEVFNRTKFGLFGKEQPADGAIERLEIAPKAQLAVGKFPERGALSNTYAIKELIFKDGTSVVDWGIFCGQHDHVDYAFVPDSVKKLLNTGTEYIQGLSIQKLSLPSDLKPQYEKLKSFKKLVKEVEFR